MPFGQVGPATLLVLSMKMRCSGCFAASSNSPICRSVPATRKAPATYSRSTGAASSASAARSFAVATVLSEATFTAEPAVNSEREPALPKPVPRSVSPSTMRMLSSGTPKTSTASCA